MIPGLANAMNMRRRETPADVAYLGHLYNGGSGSPISGVSFGAEASDRVLIAVMYGYEGTAIRDFNSVTIGGVSATVYPAGKLFSGNVDIAVAVALVPTGATGSISWSDVNNDVAIELYRATGLNGLVPANVVQTDTGAFSSKTINTLPVEAGGFIIAASGYKSSALPGSTSWSGLAEDYRSATALGGQFSLTAASAKFASAQTPTITITYSPSDNITLAAFAFR